MDKEDVVHIYNEILLSHKKKRKIELLYDPAVPLLGIYLHKTLIQKDTCTPVFIVALFKIAKT